MKLYLIRYGVYYECTQVSEYVYSTRVGHIHTWSDLVPESSKVFANKWDALRFMYQYHYNMLVNRKMFYHDMQTSHYRIPYTLDYIKRQLLSKFPEDFL